MDLLLTFIIAIVIGLIAWFIARVVPYTARRADVIGLIVFLLALVIGLGGF